MIKKLIVPILIIAVSFCGVVYSVTNSTGGSKTAGIVIEDGVLMPVYEVGTPRDPYYTNEDSDILRFCVYVETDNDTDNDGKADLVKALVQVPRAAVEGKYKAGTIYDPTPYGVGTVSKMEDGANVFYYEEAFDYNDLYRSCEKRTAEGEMSSMEAAMEANPEKDWNYSVPGDISSQGYAYMECYNYYLARGYAVVECSGIGTYGSEGFELCGTNLERDSHKAVVEWLTGDRVAYTDKENNIEIKADWSNGNVAMTGCSYGGTLPFEVATTGVEGLKTIIPYAGIASWYDYTNSQGVSTIFDVNYADYLAGFNSGGLFLDKDWTVLNKEYASWLWQISNDQAATNGNYGEIWEESDYSTDWENINCSALIVTGLNDFNVDTKQADLMMQAFKNAGANAKLVLHQDGHNFLYNFIVNGELWNETQNRWLAHYLYDVDNGAENMPEVMAQNNTDGSWSVYDSWRDFNYIDAPVSFEGKISKVTSEGLAEYVYDKLGTTELMSETDSRDNFYINMEGDMAAIYPIELPDNTKVYGVPEIHLKLSTNDTNYEGLMISAALVDTKDDGSYFDAYVLKSAIGDNVPKRVIEERDDEPLGFGTDTLEFVQDFTKSKNITYGWTDLTNPGKGYNSSEYTETVKLEAGKEYDYTIYMLPTVYTVQPGHHLSLVLTTWDPYRCFLDESFTDSNLDLEKDVEEINYVYGYNVNNAAIDIKMPIAK